MKKKLLYIPSLVIIFLLVITKIILNSNKLEFMSYVYYNSFTIFLEKRY